MNSHARLLHTMIRVRNLDASLDFYVGKPGMRLLRRQDFPEGQFTLAFVGYESVQRSQSVRHVAHRHDYGIVLSSIIHFALRGRSGHFAIETRPF